MIKTTIYRFIQIIWGFPQTAVGSILYLYYSVKIHHWIAHRDHDRWSGSIRQCEHIGQCDSVVQRDTAGQRNIKREHDPAGGNRTDTARLHFSFKGALGTFWDRDDGVSLGMFIFVPGDADEHMIVHEYAHTIQSLMLGPLYLPVVGLCSMIWNRNPSAGRGWRSGKASYYDFFTERWAEYIGRKITGR